MANSRFWKNLHPLIRRKRKSPYEDDANYAILNAIDEELKDLEDITFKSKIQSSLKTATGAFLEEYGDFFGVYRRRDTEGDWLYRKRILEALNVPRGTNESIRYAIRRYLEDNTIGINVYEPWKDIFYLNRPSSKLNGKHKMQGKYYHFAVIDVYIGSPFGEDIVNLINDFKPAGVTLHTTYDPSMNPVDPGDTMWGAIPYIETYAHTFEDTLDMFNSLNQPLQGVIRLSDTKVLNNIFNLNKSGLSSLDVLSGNYSVRNSRLHLAGLASGYKPKDETLLKDMLAGTELVEDSFYLNRDKRDNDHYSVKLRPTKELYVTLNIDTLYSIEYPELNRFEGEYEKLIEDSSLQLSFKAPRGNQIKLQAYDFKTSEWLTLDSIVADNKVNTFKAKFDNSNKYLNGNQLLFLRMSVPKDLTVEINHFHLDYTSDVVTRELGYNIKMLPSHPIVESGYALGLIVNWEEEP